MNRMMQLDLSQFVAPQLWRIDIAVGSTAIILTLHRVSDGAVPPSGWGWKADPSGESWSIIVGAVVDDRSLPKPLKRAAKKQMRTASFPERLALAKRVLISDSLKGYL